jgi:hypothetical protein
VQLARQYAQMWQDFARELDGRARMIDPSAAARRADPPGLPGRSVIGRSS